MAFPRLLPKLRTAALIQWVLEHLPQVNILLCSERRLFFLSPPHLADPDFLASHQPCIFSGLEVPWREPWLKILFAAPRPLLERLERQAEESGVSEGTERVYTCPTYLEFLPQGVHKGRCLGDLRCLDVFRQRRMIAIGDYSNDVELLQEADIAVAVDNALPEVKAVADYCTVSHNDSAIAHLIANILPRI